jgi:hypothetical protein
MRPRDRQHRLARPRQLAGEQLALDLEADDEEEHRHQPVVDPQQQRFEYFECANADRDRRVGQ